MSKTVLMVGVTSALRGSPQDIGYYERISGSSVESAISLQVVPSLELFDEYIRGVREKVDALVVSYLLDNRDDTLFQRYMGDGSSNKPQYNAQHLINRIYPENAGGESGDQDISDILEKLRGIPTLIYHGDLFGCSIQSRISQKTLDLPNIYVQDDMGRPRDMKMQDCVIENGGKMGDQVLVPWVNHVLN